MIWNDEDDDIVLPTNPPKKLSDFRDVALSYSQGTPLSRCLSHQAKIAFKHHFESGTLAPDLNEPEVFGSPVQASLHDLEVFLLGFYPFVSPLYAQSRIPAIRKIYTYINNTFNKTIQHTPNEGYNLPPNETNIAATNKT